MNCPHCQGQLSVVRPHCDFCREPLHQGQQVQVVPPISEVQRGQKSGQLMLFPTGHQWDLVHLWCAKEYHDPECNGGAEQLREMLRTEIIEEEIESLREAAYADIAQESGIICGECMDEVDIHSMSQEDRLELWHRAYRTIQELQPYFPKQN